MATLRQHTNNHLVAAMSGAAEPLRLSPHHTTLPVKPTLFFVLFAHRFARRFALRFARCFPRCFPRHFAQQQKDGDEAIKVVPVSTKRRAFRPVPGEDGYCEVVGNKFSFSKSARDFYNRKIRSMPAKSCSAVDRVSSDFSRLGFSALSDPEEREEEDESDGVEEGEEEKKRKKSRRRKKKNNIKGTNVLSRHWTDMGKGEKGGQWGNAHR